MSRGSNLVPAHDVVGLLPQPGPQRGAHPPLGGPAPQVEPVDLLSDADQVLRADLLFLVPIRQGRVKPDLRANTPKVNPGVSNTTRYARTVRWETRRPRRSQSVLKPKIRRSDSHSSWYKNGGQVTISIIMQEVEGKPHGLQPRAAKEAIILNFGLDQRWSEVKG